MSFRARLLSRIVLVSSGLLGALSAGSGAAQSSAAGGAAPVVMNPPPVMSVYKWASAARMPVYAPHRLPIGGARPNAAA